MEIEVNIQSEAVTSLILVVKTVLFYMMYHVIIYLKWNWIYHVHNMDFDQNIYVVLLV